MTTQTLSLSRSKARKMFVIEVEERPENKRMKSGQRLHSIVNNFRFFFKGNAKCVLQLSQKAEIIETNGSLALINGL